tara:strand:+ start:884 stop:1258 length:375 start_codon:yes stop_codon:yes gene_type:complete
MNTQNTTTETMEVITINTPNGIQANKELNKLAGQLDKLYKNSKNIKRGFDMGFDGTWEFVIKNTKNNRALVFKQDPRTSSKQLAFVYARAFDGANAQHSEDALYDIKNSDLLTFAKLSITQLSK